MVSASSSSIVESLLVDQSCRSLSSTIDVSSATHLKTVSLEASTTESSIASSTTSTTTTTPKAAKKRRAYFNEFNNIQYESEPLDVEEVAAYWFTDDEMGVFFQNRVEAVQEIIHEECQFASDRDSYQNTMERVFESCCMAEEEDEQNHQLSVEDAFFFPQWIKAMPAGLENVAVRAIREDITVRRQDLLNMIYEIEESEDLTEDQQMEMIAEASRELSRPSRLFAAHLGAAMTMVPKKKKKGKSRRKHVPSADLPAVAEVSSSST